jgi:hypothetical protein
MNLLRYLRSKNILKLASESIIVLSICSIMAFLFVNFIIPIPTTVENTSLQPTDQIKLLKIILSKQEAQTLSDSNDLVILNGLKQQPQINEYEVCNYIIKNNSFEDNNRISLLKQFARENLDKYFNINKLQPFDNICDVTFTIKTTKTNHDSKLPFVLETWVNEVASKV